MRGTCWLINLTFLVSLVLTPVIPWVMPYIDGNLNMTERDRMIIALLLVGLVHILTNILCYLFLIDLLPANKLSLCKKENKLTKLILCKIHQKHDYETINNYKCFYDKICIDCGKASYDATQALLLDQALNNGNNQRKNILAKYKEKYYKNLPESVKTEFFVEKL